MRMKMNKILLIILLTFSTLVAGKINIAVAANVSYAIDELKAENIRQGRKDIK